MLGDPRRIYDVIDDDPLVLEKTYGEDILIPNEPLRLAIQARVARGDLSMADLARRLGYVRPDTVRLRRMIGAGPVRRADTGEQYFQNNITHRQALSIAEAANLEPQDWEA